MIGVVAPSASRYFGRNFFHSSSPNPRRKTAPDAIVTLCSRARYLVTRTRQSESCSNGTTSFIGLVYDPVARTLICAGSYCGHYFLDRRPFRVVLRLGF